MTEKTLVIVEPTTGDIITSGKFDGGADECKKFISTIRDTFHPGKHYQILDPVDPQLPLV